MDKFAKPFSFVSFYGNDGKLLYHYNVQYKTLDGVPVMKTFESHHEAYQFTQDNKDNFLDGKYHLWLNTNKTE